MLPILRAWRAVPRDCTNSPLFASDGTLSRNAVDVSLNPSEIPLKKLSSRSLIIPPRPYLVMEHAPWFCPYAVAVLYRTMQSVYRTPKLCLLCRGRNAPRVAGHARLDAHVRGNSLEKNCGVGKSKRISPKVTGSYLTSASSISVSITSKPLIVPCATSLQVRPISSVCSS